MDEYLTDCTLIQYKLTVFIIITVITSIIHLTFTDEQCWMTVMQNVLQMNHCSITICRVSRSCLHTTQLFLKTHWFIRLYITELLLKQTTTAWKLNISIFKIDTVTMFHLTKLHQKKTNRNNENCKEQHICAQSSGKTELQNHVIKKSCSSVQTVFVWHHISWKPRRLYCRTFLNYILFSSLVAVLARSFQLCKLQRFRLSM